MTTVNIRGVGAKYATFQFNGLKLQDVADTHGAFTYFLEDQMGTSNIARLEVLRGSSGAVHGSRAIGGVVNVATDQWFDGLKAEYRHELGPFGTQIQNARLAYGQSDYFYIDLNPVYAKTKGPRFAGAYGLFYENRGASLTAGYKPTKGISLELTSLFYAATRATAETPTYKPGARDDFGLDELVPQGAVNPHNRRKGEVSQLGLVFSQEVNPAWDYAVTIASGQTQRRYYVETTFNGFNKSFYKGETFNLSTRHNVRPTDWLTVNLGWELETRKYGRLYTPFSASGNFTEVEKRFKAHSLEYFTQFQGVFLAEKLRTVVGLRSVAGGGARGDLAYDLSAAYYFPDLTKLRAQFATGYRAPSLYELYGVSYSRGVFTVVGDPDLKPEKSRGFEVGLERPFWDERLTVGVTYFYATIKDIIFSGPRPGQTRGFVQGQKSQSQGVEASLTFWPGDWVKVAASYAYVKAKNQTTPNSSQWTRVLGLPKSVFNLSLVANPTPVLTFSGQLAYRGATLDSVDGPTASSPALLYREKAAAVLDLAATYQANDWLKIFAKVNNVTNVRYTVGSFLAPGAAFYGGLSLTY
jgi:vitamin B12 transporter